MRFTIRAVALVAALGLAPLSAQTAGEGCPHQGVKTEDLPDQTQGRQDCSAGFSGTIGGVNIRTGSGVCPVSLTIIPPRDVPVSRPGSNTYAYASGSVAMVVAFFECQTTYFLFIPIGDTCRLQMVRNLGSLTNYSVAPCSRLSKNGG